MTPARFPIRTPPDQRSVANSPGLIAGSYVLHRLLMPRHPPHALHSLSHTPPTPPQPTQLGLEPGRQCTQHTTKKHHTPPPINEGMQQTNTTTQPTPTNSNGP